MLDLRLGRLAAGTELARERLPDEPEETRRVGGGGGQNTALPALERVPLEEAEGRSARRGDRSKHTIACEPRIATSRRSHESSSSLYALDRRPTFESNEEFDPSAAGCWFVRETGSLARETKLSIECSRE